MVMTAVTVVSCVPARVGFATMRKDWKSTPVLKKTQHRVEEVIRSYCRSCSKSAAIRLRAGGAGVTARGTEPPD